VLTTPRMPRQQATGPTIRSFRRRGQLDETLGRAGTLHSACKARQSSGARRPEWLTRAPHPAHRDSFQEILL